MTTAEFIRPLIGRRWRSLADGPDEFDCWGLVVFVRKGLFGDNDPPIERPPPDMTFSEARELFEHTAAPMGWRHAEKPEEGSIVILSRYDRTNHAGVFLSVPGSPGRVLHCHEDFGVMYETQQSLRQQLWSRFRYYTKVSDG